MSDAMPYTMEEVDPNPTIEPGTAEVAHDRFLATVRALDAARAEVTALRAELEGERQKSASMRMEFGVSRVLERCKLHDAATLYVRTDGQQRRVSCVECLDAENAALRARVAELEAERTQRDESVARLEREPLEAERDEWKARAEESAAQLERMREALRSQAGDTPGPDSRPCWCNEFDCVCRNRSWCVQARAAIATSAPAWLAERDRALAMRVAEEAWLAGWAAAPFASEHPRPSRDRDLAAIVDSILGSEKEKP